MHRSDEEQPDALRTDAGAGHAAADFAHVGGGGGRGGAHHDGQQRRGKGGGDDNAGGGFHGPGSDPPKV